MASPDHSDLQASFFHEVLTADVAVALGVLEAPDAAAELARFWDSDDARVLAATSIKDEDRARVVAEVERLVAEAGGDPRVAVAKRGVARELPSQLEPETAFALSESGARLRSPLRPLDQERYMGFLPLGEGGMGIVYLALDTELNRRVAFKMIRAGARDPLALESGPVSDDLAARFVQEAVVTGGLEHPGIVPVYELGCTPAGVPYYTMRVVRGERTLADAIAEATTIEDRLNLLEPFLKVCDTVGYAHSRGVIHRDLKPANIALGPYGEVVVLDWGLATMSSRPDAAGTRWKSRLETLRQETSLKTLTSALGTPGYMSPEAALGRVDEVDERSDVYSLGAILYRILTGEFPFAFTTFPEFVAGLRTVVTQVPGAPAGLASVCVHALGVKRDERYQDVGELAAAIRAWMTESAVEREVEGLLQEAELALDAAQGMEGDALLQQLDRAIAVGARILELRPGHADAAALGERARALRSGAITQRERQTRGRLLRRVGVAGLLIATAATVAVALLLDGKRREAEEARTREAVQRRLAEGERARAEEMASFMLTDLHEGLQPIGRLDLLGTVARKSLDYYEGLPQESMTDDVRRARALALGQIAEVLLASGDMAGGLAVAHEAQQMLEELLAADPENEQLQENLAAAVNRTGDVQQESGDLDEALASFRRSVALRRPLKEKDLARSLDRVGAALMRQGDRAAALASYEESLAIRRRLVGQDPTSVEVRRGLAVSIEHCADLVLETQGVTVALERYEETLAIQRRLLADAPADAQVKGDMAGVVFRIAYCLNEQGDAAGARKRYEEALAIYRRESELNPADVWDQRNVAMSLEALGKLLQKSGDAAGALANFREALGIKMAVAARDPSNTRARHDVGSTLVNLGDLAKAGGDLSGALSSFETAVATARELIALDKGNMDWQDDLFTALFRVGQVRQLMKMWPEAQAVFQESLAVVRRLAEADPENSAWQRNVGLSLDRLGDVANSLGNPGIARQYFKDSLATKRLLAGLDAANLAWQGDLAFLLDRLGAAANGAGDAAEALRFYEESLVVHRRLAEAQPTPVRRRALSLCLYNIGLIHTSAGRKTEALAAQREAESIHRAIPSHAAEHHWWADALGRAAIAAGPETPRDHLEAAYVLYADKDYARSADFFAGALDDSGIATDLTRGNRYNGACSAALAGQSERALAWLAEDLQFRREQMKPDQFAGFLEHVRVKDPDLASLRDLEGFSALVR